MYKFAAAAACAALAVFQAPLPALAASPDVGVSAPGVKEVRVTFDDLDTTKRSGAQILIRRIRSAAEVVCGPAPYGLALDEVAAYRRCVRATMERAVREVAAPQVSALYLNDRG